MPSIEARIETDRASRYLVQLCRHAAAMGAGGGGHGPRMHLAGLLARGEVRVRADCSDTRGELTFTPWGRCTATADADALTLRIDAADEENLHRIRDTVTRNIDRFGRRDHLTVNWRQPDSPPVAASDGPDA